MKTSDQYLKIVEWSEEDQCYVGMCPRMMLGGIHGDDEAKVYRELCQAVEEWIDIYKEDGEPLPAATAGKKYKMQNMHEKTPNCIPPVLLYFPSPQDNINHLLKDSHKHVNHGIVKF